MIAVFNYIKGRNVEEGANLFTAALESRTRSNGFKLQERRFHLSSRKHFLMVRAVHRWNKLPWRVVESPSLEDFRRRLDEHLRKGVETEDKTNTIVLAASETTLFSYN